MKIKLLSILVAVSIFLCGCELYLTSEYRQMNKIYTQAKSGSSFTKEELFETLDYPHCYTDTSGESTFFSYRERESAKDEMFSAEVTSWIYECHKYADPSDPYRMIITFDQSGRTGEITFEAIPGG